MENQNQERFDLESLHPVKIAEHERIKSQFISVLVKIHKFSEAEAESFYEKELIYYKKALTESVKLQRCTKISLYSSFLEVAINCISTQPGAKSESFFEARSNKSGKKDEKGNEIYIYSARLSITAYGELTLRIRAGHIIRMCNPQVVYEGDIFQPQTNSRGDLIVDYKPAIPRKSKKITGCYVCLVLPHDGRDFKWLLQDDIERLKKYSIPKWGEDKRPNALYSSGEGGQIDTGFLETKTMKHAMKTLPKLRVSDNVAFDGDDEDMPAPQPESFAPEATPAPQPAQPASASVSIDENEPF